VATVSNGDSDSDKEQETLGSDFGTKFTVDLGEIELAGEQSADIQSEIVRVIMQRSLKPPEIVEVYRRRIRPQ
jgi:translation initiation factor 1 (eIF-1/SUI1)